MTEFDADKLAKMRETGLGGMSQADFRALIDQLIAARAERDEQMQAAAMWKRRAFGLPPDPREAIVATCFVGSASFVVLAIQNGWDMRGFLIAGIYAAAGLFFIYAGKYL